MDLRKKILFILLLIHSLIVNYIYSKNEKEDSLILNNLEQAKRCLNTYNDSILNYSLNAIYLSKKADKKEYISFAMQYQGKYYIQKEDFSKAISNFIQALNIEEKRGDKKRISEILLDLGHIYYIMEKYERAHSYLQQAYNLGIQMKDTLIIGQSLYKLGKLEESLEYCETRTQEQKNNDYDKAIIYYKKSIPYFEAIKNKLFLGNIYLNIGNAYRKLNNPAKAFENIDKANKLYLELNDTISLIGLKRTKALVYTLTKEYEKAINLMQECIKQSIKHNMTGGLQFVYEDMAYIYDLAGKYKLAKEYYIKYMILRDSVYNSEKSKQIFELETKYQTEKKEKEIIELTTKNMVNKYLIIILFISIIFISVISLILIKISKNRKLIAIQELKINEQKLNQLEQEYKLMAANLILQGEENERRRLAKDLHDGIGGMLTGIKLLLNNMKGNLFITQENAKDFEAAISMLDKSISELRRVAHNMMPESLIVLGIKDALIDYCNSIENNNLIEINFQFIGEFKRVDSKLEINLFRIAQELINNAIKHSKGSHLLVQLIQEKNRICLILQDDGKGFEYNKDILKSGIGLTSVKSRVESLNGTIDINSKINEGTEITVQFFIN